MNQLEAQEQLVVADLFCGAGGLSKGFSSATLSIEGALRSYDVSYGADYDHDAIASFRLAHFPTYDSSARAKLGQQVDIENLTGNDISEAIAPKKVDVLIGGPSCQGVSAAGFRNPGDKRNRMLHAFIKTIRDIQPSWFVLENVPGLTHTNNRHLLMEIVKELSSIAGYEVAADMLLAADYGVPQLRYRLFIIGTNTGSPIRFPNPTHFLNSTASQKGYVTVGEALNGIDPEQATTQDEDFRNGSNALLNHCSASVGRQNLERIQALKPGDDWRDLPIKLLPDRFFASRSSDQKGCYGRLREDWPAYTITNAVRNVTAGCFTHPKADRPLSVREAARIQGFDDAHEFIGAIDSQYRQVGNAVPVGLARAVAESILVCHFYGEDAKSWGHAGRLNLTILEESLAGKRPFPVLTPRLAHPDRVRTRKIRPSKATGVRGVDAPSIWESNIRTDPRPDETLTLRTISMQRGNFRAAKRAKAIVAFVDGAEKDAIVNEAKASEASVKAWVDNYFAGGLEGWRAYHTPLSRIYEVVPELTEKLEKAVKTVRRLRIDEDGDRRLYMNDDLLSLIEIYGERSVRELTDKVYDSAGVDLGTMYVGDLLAVSHILLTSGFKLVEPHPSSLQPPLEALVG